MADANHGSYKLNQNPTNNPTYLKDSIPSCMIYVDKEANWFYNGNPIINKAIYQLFYKNVSRDEKGRYLITMEDEQCCLEVEDTLYVVINTEFLSNDDNKPERMELLLNDGSREYLVPESLWIGKNNVIYCMVKEGLYPARFLRPAYYMLAQHISEDEETGDFYLLVNKVSCLIKEDINREY